LVINPPVLSEIRSDVGAMMLSQPNKRGNPVRLTRYAGLETARRPEAAKGGTACDGRYDLMRRIPRFARLRLAGAKGAALGLALAVWWWALPGWTQPAKSIGIELNKVEQQGGNCRTYLVIANPGTDMFSGFTLDLIVFDRGGTISRRLAVEVAPLHPAKTMVKVFDIPETSCSGIGSILINDVLHCRDANGDVAGCVDRISTSSKLPVKLSK